VIGYLALAATLALPLALGLAYRVHSSHMFFSVVAGDLLARYFGDSAEDLIESFLHSEALAAYGEPAVLLLPVVLTTFFMRKSLGRGKTILHVVPLVVAGVVFAAFTLPILPEALQAEIRGVRIGDQILHMNSLIIGAVVSAQLIMLWVLSGRDK
jgi:hypothetical protein